MARAAVKAKQAARAKAVPAKKARSGRRGHASGNPNEQLFFQRLRRRQRWVFLTLAIVFGVSFVAIGVGSGNGNGLSQLYSGLFGGGGDSISKAQAEVKSNPAKGYKDLANAYVSKNDTVNAISAFQSYLRVKPKDAAIWGELGGLEQQQGATYAQQYQAATAAVQAADPGLAFQPSGTFGQTMGTNPINQYYTQQGASQTSVLYQQATGAYASAIKDYQTAAKLQPNNANTQYALAVAAQNVGQYSTAIAALKRFLVIDPHSPLRAQIEAALAKLEQQSGGTSTKKP